MKREGANCVRPAAAPLCRAGLAAAALLLAAGCGPASQRGAGGEPSAQVGPWGVALENMDQSVAPGDDFYRYANGTWLDTFELPADRSGYGVFAEVLDRVEAQVRDVVEDAGAGRPAAGTIAQQAGDFYKSYMDTDNIEALGLSPLTEDFAAIDAARSRKDIATLFARPHFARIVGFFDFPDPNNPNLVIPHLTQSDEALGMPGRDYYVGEDDAPRQAYLAYVTHVFETAGEPDAAARAQRLVALEISLAETHWTFADRIDRDLTNNPMTAQELIAFAPGFPWAAYFEAAGLGDMNLFNVREDSAIKALARIFGETPLETWKDFLKLQLIHDYAEVLPEAYRTAKFDMLDRTLRGVDAPSPRWMNAIHFINPLLRDGIGRLFAERYFPLESKTMVEEMTANVIAAFKRRLQSLDWMSEETRLEALAKLENVRIQIGYSSQQTDYSGVVIKPDDPIGNVRRTLARLDRLSVAAMGEPPNPEAWPSFIWPQRTVAFSTYPLNRIGFAAGFIQPPFFDPGADSAVNYGAIGAAIGHELGHLFDNQGRKFDHDGRMRDWWTKADDARFTAQADRLAAQFSAYEPLDGLHVDGKFTLGENIGDLGGLEIAYDAYKLSLNGKPAPVLNGFTGAQRLFLSYAQMYRWKFREESLRYLIANDPHSPAEYRINGVVRNMDAWYEAFGVGPEAALYLPPAQRVTIW